MSSREFKSKPNLRIAHPYPPKISNLAGKTFSRLFVFGYAGRSPAHANFWLCQCSCGNWLILPHAKLITGHTQSCGCLRVETTATKNTKHGLCCDPLYGLWAGMMNRCNNPHVDQYPHYGGKGVYVCERWYDFALFKQDVGRRPSPKHSLDRKDGNGPYSPENTRWATPTQQMRNMSRNHVITVNGHTRVMSEWAEVTGIPYTTLRSRMRLGWSPEEALGFVPPKDRRTGVKLGPNKRPHP